MGIFDIFKSKDNGAKSSKNPLLASLKSAGFDITNLEVDNDEGVVILNGIVENGSGLENMVNFLRRTPGVKKVVNKIKIEDLGDKNIKYRVETKVKFLNVRKGPSTDFQIKGKFATGEEVVLVKMVNEHWYKVKGEQMQGYCHTDFLKKV